MGGNKTGNKTEEDEQEAVGEKWTYKGRQLQPMIPIKVNEKLELRLKV